MFGERCASALKPTRKNLKFTKIDRQQQQELRQRERHDAFAWSPRNAAGSGQPNMCPMDR